LAEDQKELEKQLGHSPISIEEARQILSKVPGSMADDIIADRGDRIMPSCGSFTNTAQLLPPQCCVPWRPYNSLLR
jgi:hypothetical protein